MKEFYVYIHYTKDTKEIFYVGKGKNSRISDKNDRNQFWHNVANKHGYKYKKVKTNLSEKEAFEAEENLIKNLKQIGLARTNIHSGGFGGNTMAYASKEEIENWKKSLRNGHKNMSKETRDKLIATRKKNAKGSNNSQWNQVGTWTGKKFNDNHRKNLSESLKRHKRTELHNEKLRNVKNKHKIKIVFEDTGKEKIFDTLHEAHLVTKIPKPSLSGLAKGFNGRHYTSKYNISAYHI